MYSADDLVSIAKLGRVTGNGKKDITITDKDIVVYTDLFLDDLCAIEYLSRFRENVYIVPVDPFAEDSEPYTSDKVKSLDDFIKWTNSHSNIKVLGNNVRETLDEKEFPCTCLLLCKATQLVKDLQTGIKFNDIVAMIGTYGDNHVLVADDEWNAMQDIESFNWLNKNVVDITYVAKDICENIYLDRTLIKGTKAFSDWNLEFYDEYITKMLAINDSIACYDLVAAFRAIPEIDWENPERYQK